MICKRSEKSLNHTLRRGGRLCIFYFLSNYPLFFFFMAMRRLFLLFDMAFVASTVLISFILDSPSRLVRRGIWQSGSFILLHFLYHGSGSRVVF
jgi:hypothetical protein